MAVGQEIETEVVVHQDNKARKAILVEDGIEYHDVVVYLSEEPEAKSELLIRE